jgi:hypothetical protein
VLSSIDANRPRKSLDGVRSRQGSKALCFKMNMVVSFMGWLDKQTTALNAAGRTSIQHLLSSFEGYLTPKTR